MSLAHPSPRFPCPLPALTLGLILALVDPRGARAEDTLSYKFQSWQEDRGRIRVDAHYALAEKDLGLATKLRVIGVIDTIVGATPTGEPPPAGSDEVPLAELKDRRKAWQGELTHQFSRSAVTGSVASSRESDYESLALALNTLTDFNQRSTSVLFGMSYADDDITARFLPEPRRKRTREAIVGLTQLLDPLTSLTLNLTYGEASGYLSDPYKIVSRTTELLPGLTLPLTFPENRPSTKERWIVYTSLHRRVPRLDGAVEASFRWLDDSFGTTSQTFSFEWFQRAGPRLILRPAVRVYQQSAADFYHPRLDETTIVPSPRPTGSAPYYSSDYRLAALRTWTWGFKAVWEVRPGLTVDATFERYVMEARDRTPRRALVDADVFTVGIRLWR